MRATEHGDLVERIRERAKNAPTRTGMAATSPVDLYARVPARAIDAAEARLGFPLLPKHLQEQAAAAYAAASEGGVNAGALAAARAVAGNAEEIAHVG